MERLKVILRVLFESVKVSIETFILPTGTYLLPSVCISAVILVVTILCKIFHVFTLLDIPGAVLGLVVLLGICFIERKERSDISNIYRAAQARVTAITRRQSRATVDAPDEIDNDGDNSGGSGSGPAGASDGEDDSVHAEVGIGRTDEFNPDGHEEQNDPDLA